MVVHVFQSRSNYCHVLLLSRTVFTENDSLFCFFCVVLKLLKTAEGIRSLLDTVGKALPQVSI